MKKLCKLCNNEFETRSAKREICFEKECNNKQQLNWKIVPSRLKTQLL